MWRFYLALSVILLACSPQPVGVKPQASPSSSPSTQPSPEPVPVKSPEPRPESSPIASQITPPITIVNNLLANPGVENNADGVTPLYWEANHYGDNQALLALKKGDAFEGQHYLSTQMADYQDGDAKWIFDPLPLTGNQWYEYSTAYRADGRNRLIWVCNHSDGSRKFRSSGQSHASSTWAREKMKFYLSPASDCKVSVYHTLDRTGYLDSDAHALYQVAARPLPQAYVSVTFDDIWTTAATVGASELEQRGWKGSFYVTGVYARNSNSDYAKVDQLKTLIARGHEIGSHAETHSAMSTLDNQALDDQYRNNQAYLKFLGADPRGIAYPFGDFDEKVEIEGHRFHSYARTSLEGLNDADFDPFRLQIFPITNETTLDEVKTYIDDARRTSTWLILLYHDLKEGKSDSAYTTSAGDYRAALDYLQAQKMDVKPVKDVLKALGKLN